MKKGLLFFCFLFAATFASAQNFVTKYYGHFAEQDNSTVIHVSAATFKLAANVVPESEEDERDIKEFVQSIRSFDLVEVPDLEDPKSVYNAALRKLDGSFEELIRVKEAKGKFSVHVDESGGIVRELVGMGYDDEFVVFSLVGEMDLDMIGSFVAKIQSENLSSLKKVSDYHIGEVKVFPNPVTANSEITLEMPGDMVGASATLVDVNGAVLKSFTVKNTTHKIKTDGLQPGYYFINLNKDEVNMKKKVLVVQ